MYASDIQCFFDGDIDPTSNEMKQAKWTTSPVEGEVVDLARRFLFPNLGY